MHYVQFIHRKTGKVEHQIACASARSAERVLGGASINLDHDNYELHLSDVPASISKEGK